MITLQTIILSLFAPDPLPGRITDQGKWLWFGAGLVIVGGALYSCIFVRHRLAFRGLSRWNVLSNLVSQAPSDDARAYPHVLAGVLTCTGGCLLLGAWIGSMTFVRNNFSYHGTALTSSGLVFGVLISFISFWTLCQTKRIERLQGYEIEGFERLTELMAEQLDKINREFRDSHMEANRYHRFYLATTNPYFGVLSFPNSHATSDFRSAVLDAANNVELSGHRPFELRLICGTNAAMEEMSRQFFNQSLAYRGKDAIQQECERANSATDKFLKDIENHAPGTIVRSNFIPEIQFAIIGNTVYEFILLEPRPGGGTSIAGARRIEDGVVSERFRRQFATFQTMLNGNGVGVPAATPASAADQAIADPSHPAQTAGTT